MRSFPRNSRAVFLQMCVGRETHATCTKGQAKGWRRHCFRNGKKVANRTKILLTQIRRMGDSPAAPVSAFPRRVVPTFPNLSARRKSQQGAPVSAQTETKSTLDLDREVIRCKTCGLVQYRTRTGNCRRCVRVLPQRLEFLIPPLAPEEEAGAEPQQEKQANQETVENIGQRIRQLRESRSMTQSQLQSRSKVSRSYLSRIESGQMTPSLGTLEKISEALNVGLNRFFIPEYDGEALLEDPFIQGLRPFMRRRAISALSVIRRGCRSPRRGMAMPATSASAIRVGLRSRTPMAIRRAIRCGVRSRLSGLRASLFFNGLWRDKFS